jgi:hypothetical protein
MYLIFTNLNDDHACIVLPRSVDAIDEAFIGIGIAVATMHERPHYGVDAARRVALGTRESRRRRVQLRHAEDGSHGPEPCTAQLRAAAVLGHALCVEHRAAEQIPRPCHQLFWGVGQRLPTGQHLYHIGEVEGAAERHPRRRLAPVWQPRQHAGEPVREVGGGDAVLTCDVEVETLGHEESHGLRGVAAAGDIKIAEIELPGKLQRAALVVDGLREFSALVAEGQTELQGGELIHVRFHERVVTCGGGERGPRRRAVQGTRVLRVYRHIWKHLEEEADAVQLLDVVAGTHGHDLEAAHHRRGGRNHGRRDRKHGGVGRRCDASWIVAEEHPRAACGWRGEGSCSIGLLVGGGWCCGLRGRCPDASSLI